VKTQFRVGKRAKPSKKILERTVKDGKKKPPHIIRGGTKKQEIVGKLGGKKPGENPRGGGKTNYRGTMVRNME